MEKLDKAKRDYIAGKGSYRALAARYGIPFRTLGDRGKAEGWVQLRQQARDRAVTKTVEAVAERDAAVDMSLMDAADALLGKIAALAGGELTPKMVRELTGALRDIKEIKGIKGALDIQEQEARIDKLRREAERQMEAAEAVEVCFTGAEMEELSG